VLKLAPVLEELAGCTAQLGAMHWLGYFLSTQSIASKPPSLVLQLNDPSHAHPLQARNIRAAALFFEYRVAGIRTRVFSTDDAVGYRTVVAPPQERDRFARRAAQLLLRAGAHVVLANYEPLGGATLSVSEPDVLTGWRERTVPCILPLATTFDETLARLGRATRFNLRYYRRRLAKRLELEFVEDVRQHITLEEFAALNAASLNPVTSDHEIHLRWNCSCKLPGSFVVGLRTSQGKWLSLISGWRHETRTVLHWQMNAAGYERDSIGTVMRSFFIEHEIAGGARELLIYGGTSHTINHAFTQHTVADLLICRDSFRARICRNVARHLSCRAGFLRSNHLLRTLGELEMRQYEELPEDRSAYPGPAVTSSL
jgi:hypothetical protein